MNSNDITEVIKASLNIFNDRYDDSVRDLKNRIPDDTKDSYGTLFWSGPRRSPQPVVFNANDETHIDFIWSCSNLIFANLGMPALPRDQTQQIVSQLAFADYVLQVESPEQTREEHKAT